MSPNPIELIAPYGGKLVDLRVPQDAWEERSGYAKRLPAIQISHRSLCDLELIANGSMSPLDRFMGQADYISVLEKMRLANGVLFPIPITLPADAGQFEVGQEIALRDSTNQVLAIMRVDEVFDYDPVREQLAVLGTSDAAHPLVAEMAGWGKVYLSGPLQLLELPTRFDYPDLYLSPVEMRQKLAEIGSSGIVAFQTANTIHRVHEALTKRAMEMVSGILLMHPTVGISRPGDTDHFTRVRIYKNQVAKRYPAGKAVLALLPLAMRYAGPREAVWHAIVRRNYGANSFIVGTNHADPGTKNPIYPATAAQELALELSDEIGVKVVAVGEMLYLPGEDRFAERHEIPPDREVFSLTKSQVREEYLADGKPLPEWHTLPEISAILSESYPPKHRQGFCVWFTGLPSAGKSTVANVLSILLRENGRRTALLDGDIVRTHLSKGLGFSREDRDTNILRMGFVASEIAKAGGGALVAAVSPYESTRNQVRHFFPKDAFIVVFVDTPLRVCEERDVKGLYLKARKGEATGVTGVDDPYEVPPDAEIILDTVNNTASQNAQRVLELLQKRGYVLRDTDVWE